jgi:hypothetical protein
VTIAVPGATTGNASNVMITPMGGFTGAVNLSCKLNTSPAGAQYTPTCSMAPASISISSASAATAMMTISSTAASAGEAVTPALQRTSRLAAGIGTGVFGIFILCVPRRAGARRSLLSLIFVLAMISGLVRSGGGSTGGGGGGGIAGTTPGGYTFYVFATTPGPNAGLRTVLVKAPVSVTVQ